MMGQLIDADEWSFKYLQFSVHGVEKLHILFEYKNYHNWKMSIFFFNYTQ